MTANTPMSLVSPPEGIGSTRHSREGQRAKPEPSTPPPLIVHQKEDEEGDLNKALGVECFQQILHTVPSVPDEHRRCYSEEDFEYHRHSSHHIHHPLARLPSDGRKKKSSKKKKSGGHKSSSTGAPTIEEGEEEDEERPLERDGQAAVPTASAVSDSPTERVQVTGPADSVEVALRGGDSESHGSQM